MNYIRSTILVVINFTGEEVDFIPDNSGSIEFLISSYGNDNGDILRPYEARCYRQHQL